MVRDREPLAEAKKVLKNTFGFQSFRGGQGKVIESLLGGSDTLAIMPTGSGKSLCYQVPALLFAGVTLVISPLVSLMKDQVDDLNELGISATFINSTLAAKEMRRRLEETAKGTYRLVYVAPERLESEGFLPLAQSIKTAFIAVDEAHCVSRWGHDFRPSYRRIAAFLKELPERPVVGAFTATATPEVKADIINLLGLKAPRIIVTGYDRPNLYFSVLRGVNKEDYILQYLAAKRENPGIIYTATRKETDKLAGYLQKHGLKCAKYHAGMRNAEREKNQEAFLRDDVTVMVATNAFGMGIDKSNVRFVIHYSIPGNIEAYYQEAGRAGRDGEPGECIVLYHPKDVLMQRYLIEKSVYSPKRKKNELNKLQALVNYCHTAKCLRKELLAYFGEEDTPENCGNCGNCRDEGETVDVTLDAQKVLSCAYRLKGRFGAAMLARVLKGAQNKRIRQLKLDRLSTYGLLADRSIEEIRDFIGFLTAEGYLHLTEGSYPLVKLGRKAAAVIKGREKVMRRLTQLQDTAEEDLFSVLRRLRKQVADRENRPPYMVFSDATLREMSEKCPEDDRAFRRITGVGEKKAKKYGPEFLAAIKKYRAAGAAGPADDEER